MDLVIRDGLTGVVGPNGCGKSNLLEALRWVMGENRPTAMRGGGMEDVIFAGAASRPQRNFAEVTLTLDNSDRTAPSVFNDSDRIEIIRRITRDAGSAFKANGRDMRARDVQMLFADASTGSHSPSLVRQGQIAELISAKPKSRRRILEEAAGISGLYQRRHEAELKLSGAEANLLRIEDVLEQLQSQLSQLAKQARQATRYRKIGEDLRRAEGVLLYRRWREAEQEFAHTVDALNDATKVAAQAQAQSYKAAQSRAEMEEKVPPLRQENAVAAALLQRLLVERDILGQRQTRARETIESLSAQIAQINRDIGRENSLNADAVQSLEKLAAEDQDLDKAAIGHDAAVAAAADAAQQASEQLQNKESGLGRITEDVARLAARHQSAQRLLADGRATLERNRSESDKARAAGQQASRDADAAAEMFAKAQSDQHAAQLQSEKAKAALLKAEADRTDTQNREATARARHSQSQGEANALRAEVAALQRLMARESDESVQVLDQVTVSPGFEAAFGAALADDLRAPVIAVDGESGWVQLPTYAAVQPLPGATPSLAEHVSVPQVLARRMSQVGLVAQESGNAMQQQLLPGQRLVSLQGDVWRWDGFRSGAEDAPGIAAIRLQQINRLHQLKTDLDEADVRAKAAELSHKTLHDQLSRQSEFDESCRVARRRADDAVTAAAHHLARAEGERAVALARLEASELAVKRFDEDAKGNLDMMHEAEATVAGLDDLDEARTHIEAEKTAVENARAHMLTQRAIADDLRREGEARSRRKKELEREIENWTKRRETADGRAADLSDRLSISEREFDQAQNQPAEIDRETLTLQSKVEEAETRKAESDDALSSGESQLRTLVAQERSAESSASENREIRARADAMSEAAENRVKAMADRILEDTKLSPDALLDSIGADPDQMPSAERVEIEVAKLHRQRDALGAVNLRAEEDTIEIQNEFDALSGDKQDLDAAISKLRTGIANLNKEGRTRLLDAFDEVNVNFERLFKHLFGGGEAKLILVESDDPLQAGLEIMCQPPGKKLSTMSLLSGGEQTLTALSLIFAVFLANPSPICVLDEVDAPLDDANVTRFCDLLDEMTRQTETRFLIITHHAVTMSRMNRLFGVTMAEQGVSQLVSVDLSRAEELVA